MDLQLTSVSRYDTRRSEKWIRSGSPFLKTLKTGAKEITMTYIITRLCRDCVDTGCVAVCPVDCIYEYTGSDGGQFPNQLYIHPDECIDCGACEPECPWQAIFEEVSVPGVFNDDTPLNYATRDNGGDF